MSSYSFSIASVEDNSDGWGPVSVPEKFKDIPYYAPFNKGDKLGKAADWQQQFQGKSKYNQPKDTSGGVSTIFNYYYQDDDSTFQIVDSTKITKPRFGLGARGRFQKGFNQQLRQQTKGQNVAWQQQQKPSRGQTQYQQQGRKNLQKNQYTNRTSRWGQQEMNPMNRKREASVQVKDDWKLIEEFEFTALNKLSADEPPSEDLMTCGSLEYYNKNYDRVSSKSDTNLERTERAFFNVTTSDDPIIRQLSMEGAGTVFATDAILSHLMCCSRSVYPWDIIVQKVGSKLFFDKRDGSTFDFLTVSESAAEQPTEDARDTVNSAGALMREATFVNQNFSQQVLTKGETLKLSAPNPFQSEGQEVAAVGYKYRKWNIGPDVVLVARCEIDGVAQSKGKDVFLTIKALNEHDLKASDWRKKIDSQRGGVLATELKNNSNKLAKWTVQSLLTGTDSIKLGFVSRVSTKDFANHQILATQDYKPKEFAQQINLNIKNAWGILKRVVDLCMKQPTGKYILLKEPEKASLKLYSVPEGAFESLASEDSDKGIERIE